MNYSQERRARAKRQARAKRRARRRKQVIVGIAVAGVLILLLGVALVSWSNNRGSAPAFTYGPGDIARQNPIRAVHEIGQAPAVPFLTSGGPQPKIAVSERLFNLGSIGPTEKVQRTFAARNDGDAPLTISRAYTTCDCTTADISATVIQPGQVAEVTLVFDAGLHDSRGQTVRRGLIIENNDPLQSRVEIWVQAAVRRR